MNKQKGHFATARRGIALALIAAALISGPAAADIILVEPQSSAEELPSVVAPNVASIRIIDQALPVPPWHVCVQFPEAPNNCA